MRALRWIVVGLALTACRGDDPEEIESKVKTDPDTDTDTDTDVVESECGDGEITGSEECDDGADNADDAHCLTDCTLNTDWTLRLGGPELDEAGVDGIASDDVAHSGAGSWRATPSEDTNGDGADKFELFVDPKIEGMEIFGAMTVADIAHVSYATNKADDQGRPDFYLVIYTEPDGVDDQSWYGYRLIAAPSFSRNLDAPADEWAVWSTDAGTNQLAFVDSENSGTQGFMGQPTLDELLADTAFDWSAVAGTGLSTAIDYGAEQVKYLSIQTGSPWESTFDGYIDSVELVHVNGNRIRIDLEE